MRMLAGDFPSAEPKFQLNGATRAAEATARVAGCGERVTRLGNVHRLYVKDDCWLTREGINNSAFSRNAV